MAQTDRVFTGSIPALYDRYLGPLLFAPYAADLAQRVARAGAGRVLETAAGTGIVERLFGQRLVAGSPRYDVAVHVSGGETVLEFEASTSDAIVVLLAMASTRTFASRAA
jgi:hypothetical protein